MRRIQDAALLLRSSPFGESDAVVTFLTQDSGKLSAVARGARKNSKRFGGALESLHTLRVELEDRGKELLTLKEASVVELRLALQQNLEGIEAVGIALRWARALCPPRTPERDAFDALTGLIASVDAGAAPRTELARVGLRLLVSTGFALELEQCVRCGRKCPDGRPAAIDVAQGGLVCSACGGARVVIPAALRRNAMAILRGDDLPLSPVDAEDLVRLVELALAAHGGIES